MHGVQGTGSIRPPGEGVGLTSRASKPRYYCLHDRKGSKVGPVAVLKDDGRDHGNAVKVQVVGTDKTFTLSPIPASKPIQELPTNMTTDVPEHYGAACGNALKRLCHRIDPHGRNLPTRYPANKKPGYSTATASAKKCLRPRYTCALLRATLRRPQGPRLAVLQIVSRTVRNSAGMTLTAGYLCLCLGFPIPLLPTTLVLLLHRRGALLASLLLLLRAGVLFNLLAILLAYGGRAYAGTGRFFGR